MRSDIEDTCAGSGRVGQGFGEEKGAILGQLRDPYAAAEQVGTLTLPACTRNPRRFGNDAIDSRSLHFGADLWPFFLSCARLERDEWAWPYRGARLDSVKSG
ncbi:glutamyl-tRNA reductase [Novosphingobium sp. PY1]|nr:glutamyl-tRNA reductase [Novosphingobium sp. PY1]